MVRGVVLGVLAFAVFGGATLTRDPQPGRYSITYQLELPHLERYAAERVVERCVDPAVALPVLGAGTTFDGCEASPFRREGAVLRYSIACEGRAAARAMAVYRLEPTGFRARIAITLGAKNMTMVEVQNATRIGACE